MATTPRRQDVADANAGRVAPPVSAEELALRAQGGSVEAYSALVEMFQARLYNFLLRRAGVHDAEDLAQETFVRAWQRIHLYRATWRFSTWLFTIAVRLAAGRARRASAAPMLTLSEELSAGRSRNDRGDLDAEERRRFWALVDRALAPEPRAAVWLRYVEDLSMSEIAAVMGKSEVGVRVMLHRARAVLAERMTGTGEEKPRAVARAAAGALP